MEKFAVTLMITLTSYHKPFHMFCRVYGAFSLTYFSCGNQNNWHDILPTLVKFPAFVPLVIQKNCD